MGVLHCPTVQTVGRWERKPGQNMPNGPISGTSGRKKGQKHLQRSMPRDVRTEKITQIIFEMKYYYITTEHLENKVWFRDDEDFKVAMNAIAVIAALMGIKILSFILMSNHVHILIFCNSLEEAEWFINELKRHYSRYVHNKYGTRELLRRNCVDIQEVINENESLEKVIAYIQMNSVAANICAFPVSYKWGTGSCFFSETNAEGNRIDSYSSYRLRKILHTKRLNYLPGSLIICKEGYVLPESYVDVSFVESLFRTPKRMDYFLRNSSKAKRKLESEEQSIPSFRDQVIIPAVNDLCRTLFQQSDLLSLSEENLSELLKQLRFRFACNVEQLSRVTGLPYKTIADLLDRY